MNAQSFVHLIFEDQVAKAPSKIAVEEEHSSTSYQELNTLANALAATFAELNIEQGKIVATMMPSSSRLIATMLAAFKGNVVYMPLDKALAAKQLEQALTQTYDDVLVCFHEELQSIAAMDVVASSKTSKIITIDKENIIRVFTFNGTVGERLEVSIPSELSNPSVKMNENDGNYIFYTSGSTGNAKAILGRHNSLAHFINWEMEQFAFGPNTRISQIAAITFDASLKDILPAICCGGTVVIPSAETKNNPTQLTKWIDDKMITVLQTVPSIYRLILASLESEIKYAFEKLQYINLAGEMLFGKDIQRWNNVGNPETRIVNLYGATESTILKTFHIVDEVPESAKAAIPVGKGLDKSTVVAIINRSNKICRVGEIGDVYIKSPYLTKGYLNNDELNEAMFVQNPLITDREDIIYKTGDLGRYRKDWSIELLGRKDFQVKVNGVRIEMTGVEHALLQLSGIQQAVVIANKDGESTELVAYYTGTKRDAEELREMLGTFLNRSAIPSHFIHMEQFPLNINGKVDRKALPKPELMLNQENIELAKTKTEEVIAAIYGEILNLEQVDRSVSFFKIGGSSLKAIRVISKVFKAFDVSLKMGDIFNNPSVAALAELVDNATVRPSTITITKAEKQDSYPLTETQQRFWIESQRKGQDAIYNEVKAYRIAGELDVEKLNVACAALVSRHEILRTSFVATEKGPLQKVLDAAEVLKAIEVEAVDSLEAAVTEAEQEGRFSFDLTRGSLFRVRLLQLGENDHVMLLTMHHIITDGWTMELLIQDFFKAYYGAGLQADEQTLQFADVAVWEQKMLADKGDELKQFWSKQLEGKLNRSVVPFDQNLEVELPIGDEALELDAGTCKQLDALSTKLNASPFMVSLSVLQILLGRYTGAENIIIGSPVAARESNGLENVAGPMLNTVAYRSQINNQDTFESFAGTVRQTVVDVLDHGRYPFNKVVEILRENGAENEFPLFEVGFTWHDQHQTEQAQPTGLIVEPILVNKAKAVAPMWLHGRIVEGNWQFNLHFDSTLYKSETMQLFMQRFNNLLQAITQNSQSPISALKLDAEAAKTNTEDISLTLNF